MAEHKLKLPKMPPLQALVVTVLFDGERSSREIQQELAFRGVEKQMSLVYRLLARMELAEYVCGRYRQYRLVEGNTIRQRYYRLSERGYQAWKETVGFYAALDPPGDDFQPLSREECWAEE
ncbi:MAG: hypothetical protein ACYTG0_18365 [Planctomycetota bacterium]|jgi:DNA-binding PadR family transcriptional regulator